MKTWLKGGLIGAGISAVMSIIFLISSFMGLEGFGFYLFVLNTFIGMPLTIILNFLGLKMYDPSYDSVSFWIGGIFDPLIVSFILGALIGLIIGKIKSRKDER